MKRFAQCVIPKELRAAAVRTLLFPSQSIPALQLRCNFKRHGAQLRCVAPYRPSVEPHSRLPFQPHLCQVSKLTRPRIPVTVDPVRPEGCGVCRSLLSFGGGFVGLPAFGPKRASRAVARRHHLASGPLALSRLLSQRSPWA